MSVSEDDLNMTEVCDQCIAFYESCLDVLAQLLIQRDETIERRRTKNEYIEYAIKRVTLDDTLDDTNTAFHQYRKLI